jgi:hypothetical protein
LLELPDVCLHAVLRCLAPDPRSLFSAARAHSKLYQAALMLLTSIKCVSTWPQPQQQHINSFLLYLSRHCQRVSGIDTHILAAPDPLSGRRAAGEEDMQAAYLHEFPAGLQLRSLVLHAVGV